MNICSKNGITHFYWEWLKNQPSIFLPFIAERRRIRKWLQDAQDQYTKSVGDGIPYIDFDKDMSGKYWILRLFLYNYVHGENGSCQLQIVILGESINPNTALKYVRLHKGFDVGRANGIRNCLPHKKNDKMYRLCRFS